MRRSTELWLIVPDIVPAIVPATVPSAHYSASYSTQNGCYVQHPFWALYSFFTVPAIAPQMGTVHSAGFGHYIVPARVAICHRFVGVFDLAFSLRHRRHAHFASPFQFSCLPSSFFAQVFAEHGFFSPRGPCPSVLLICGLWISPLSVLPFEVHRRSVRSIVPHDNARHVTSSRAGVLGHPAPGHCFLQRPPVTAARFL